MNDPILYPPEQKKQKGLSLKTIIGLLIGLSMFASLLNAYGPKASSAGLRDSFVRECVSGAYGAGAIDDQSSACGCAYDKLQVKYNGKLAAEADRINTAGFSVAEQAVLASCAS